VEVFLFSFNAKEQRCELERSCTMSSPTPMLTIAGPLCGAAVVEETPGHERLVLCWPAKASTAKSGPSLVFAGAELRAEAEAAASATGIQLCIQPLASASASAAASLWVCVGGFIVDFTSPTSGEPWSFALRDAQLGMQVSSGTLPPAIRPSGRGRSKTLVVSDASGTVTALVGGGEEGLVAGLRWTLPSFGLQMLIGSKATQTSREGDSLQPLHEVLAGKRSRDDGAVSKLFAPPAKRVASEKALSAELRSRKWRPSHDLLDVIIKHECWEVSKQLLMLPELDEDLAVRPLVARSGLLPAVVRRTFDSQRLPGALRTHLPAAQLPGLIETLLELLEAHREYTEKELCEKMPGFPCVPEVVQFLGALADGCLTSLADLEPELLERVEEALAYANHDGSRVENLYGAVAASCSVKKAPRLAPELRPVEVFLLPV